MPELSLGRRFFNFRTLISFVVAFALLAFLLTRLEFDWGEALARIRRADPVLVLAAILVYYTTFVFRAIRWRIMLRNAGVATSPSVPVLSAIILLSWFVNCIVPAKLGDVYRAYLLRTHGASSLSMAGGTIVAERLIDFSFVLVLLGASTFIGFRGRVPEQIVPFLEIGGAAVLLAGLALLALRRWEALIPRFLPHRLHGVYERFHVGTMGAFGSYGFLLLFTALAWLAEIGRFWLVALAVGLDFGSPQHQAAATTFVSLGSALFTTATPTPGGLGGAEAAIFGALKLLGQAGDVAVAAALLDRLISYWSLILTGALVYFLWEPHQSGPARVLERANRD